MSLQTMLVELDQKVGPTIIAVASGTKDRNLVSAWAEENSASAPSDEEVRRISSLYTVFTELAHEESEDIARAWIIGSNPCFGVAPVMLIRDDRFEDLAISYTTYLEGQFA
jgi:hypothetical protein